MSKPVLAVDIDEVLFPFVPEMLKHYNELDGSAHRVEEVLSFEFSIWDEPDEAKIERVHQFSRLDHREIPPLEGTIKALRRLRKSYSIAIVTSRDPEFEASTRNWLDHHFGGLYDRLILTGNHYSGRAYRSKVEVCLELGASYLVDDQLHYAADSSKHGLPMFLFGNYPWNKAEVLPKGVTRVAGWGEVVDQLLPNRKAQL